MNIPDEELKRFLEAFIDDEVQQLIDIVNTEHEIDYTEHGDQTSPLDVESYNAYFKLRDRALRYTARYLAPIEDKEDIELSNLNFERLNGHLLNYLETFLTRFKRR